MREFTILINDENITFEVSFIDDTFACSQFNCSMYMKINPSSTSGGFQAALRVDTAVQCETVNLYDESNYGADLQHDMLDFSLFRKIVVTPPTGLDYVMSSISPYDELITPAANNILSYPKSVAEGGVYTFKLITVPTYASGGHYSIGDCVCLLDGTNVVFYKSLQNNNEDHEPVNGVGWEDYWLPITESELANGYSNTKYYGQWCEIVTCKHELESVVYCSTKTICNTDICKNECFQAYLKLQVVERVLAEAETQQWYDKMIEYYNLAKQLCNCNTPCR